MTELDVRPGSRCNGGLWRFVAPARAVASVAAAGAVAVELILHRRGGYGSASVASSHQSLAALQRLLIMRQPLRSGRWSSD